MIEGNQLMAQATGPGQGKFAIFPESPTQFFAKVNDIQIEFANDEAGKVKQLTLRQGPVGARTAPRK
jgi:hypothetical protein